MLIAAFFIAVLLCFTGLLHFSWFAVADIAELSAEVKSPSGRVEKANIVQSSDNTYTIRFVPKVKRTGLLTFNTIRLTD